MVKTHCMADHRFLFRLSSWENCIKQMKAVRKGKASAGQDWTAVLGLSNTDVGRRQELLGQQSASTDKQAQRGEMRRYIRVAARDELGRGRGEKRVRGKESQWEMKEVKEIQEKVDMRTNSKDVIAFGVCGGGGVLLLWLLDQQMGIDNVRRQILSMTKRVVVLRRFCQILSITLVGGVVRHTCSCSPDHEPHTLLTSHCSPSQETSYVSMSSGFC